MEGYYAESPMDDPRGPTTGSYRVIRGGGWTTRRGTAGRRSATASRPGSGTTTWASVSPEFRRTSRSERSRCAPAAKARDEPKPGKHRRSERTKSQGVPSRMRTQGPGRSPGTVGLLGVSR